MATIGARGFVPAQVKTAAILSRGRRAAPIGIKYMCKHGGETLLLVPIPANLSYTGEFRWDVKGIDSCIAPIVKALNDAGIYTANCCCGHGKSDGSIILHDGRELILRAAPIGISHE